MGIDLSYQLCTNIDRMQNTIFLKTIDLRNVLYCNMYVQFADDCQGAGDAKSLMSPFDAMAPGLINPEVPELR